MQVSETSPWSKDVQRLLWAAGEARVRTSRRERNRPAIRRRLAERSAPAAGADFFTEWQPATG
ncbi:MAG TPA: hypothetical protein VM388_10775 [Acidimicrobiales bacterium]|nr:hypothetical protein [Acidimicrobiales bacterium]